MMKEKLVVLGAGESGVGAAILGKKKVTSTTECWLF